MFSILDDDSDSEVAAAIEQNNIDLFLFAAAMGRKTILREEDFTVVIGKPWWPNYLVEPRFRDETLVSRIHRIREEIEQRKLPAAPEVWSESKAEESESASVEQRIRGDGPQSSGDGDAVGCNKNRA